MQSIQKRSQMIKPNFSIVIPTKDRPHYLKRTLNFLSKEKCSFPILIGDSSIDDFDCSAYSDLNIKYTNFSTDISVIDRIIEKIKTTETKYIMMLGDDDFVNLQTISELCDFLDNNPDFVAVDGQEIRVVCRESGISRNIFHRQPDLSQKNNEERLFKHCKLYWPTFYTIQKRDVLLNSFLFQKKILHLGCLFQELGGSIISVIQGKYKNFDKLYLIRQNFHENSTKVVWWTSLIKEKGFADKRDFFIDSLYNFANNICLKDNRVSREIISKAFALYCKPFYMENRKDRYRGIIRDVMPIFFQNIVKKIIKIFDINHIKDNENYNAECDFYKKVQAILTEHPFGVKI